MSNILLSTKQIIDCILAFVGKLRFQATVCGLKIQIQIDDKVFFFSNCSYVTDNGGVFNDIMTVSMKYQESF